MKLKYYLRGLGIGIIVTTIILVSCFSMQKPKMTDEQIIEKAAQLGMIMPEQNSAVIAETETTEPEETEQKNEQQIAAEKLQQETETQIISAGTYQIPYHASYEEITNILKAGPMEQQQQ